MVKQPNESIYVKSFNRIDEMRQVYEMHYLQHLSVPEIISRTGVKRTQVYKFLNIFAAEYPDLVEQMKKKREDVSTDVQAGTVLAFDDVTFPADDLDRVEASVPDSDAGQGQGTLKRSLHIHEEILFDNQ